MYVMYIQPILASIFFGIEALLHPMVGFERDRVKLDSNGSVFPSGGWLSWGFEPKTCLVISAVRVLREVFSAQVSDEDTTGTGWKLCPGNGTSSEVSCPARR